MQRSPQKTGSTFLSLKQLSLSIFQGLMITAGCLGIGYYYMQHGSNDATVRTVIFITLLFSNIFLTLVNRSFHYSIFKTLAYKNNMVPVITGITLFFIATLLYIPFIRTLFNLHSLNFPVIVNCFFVAIAGTLWIEIWKLIKRKGSQPE